MTNEQPSSADGDTPVVDPTDPVDPAPTDPEGADPETFDAEKAREKIRKVNSEAAALRKRLQDAEAKVQGVDDKDKTISTQEAEILRLRVAVKHGLPESLVKRLTGTTEEEILQDAEELMELFGSKKPPTQQPREKLRGGGDPTVNPDDADVEKIVDRVFSN